MKVYITYKEAKYCPGVTPVDKVFNKLEKAVNYIMKTRFLARVGMTEDELREIARNYVFTFEVQ